MKSVLLVLLVLHWVAWSTRADGGEPRARLKVRASWGHRSPADTSFFVRLVATGMEISDLTTQPTEAGTGFKDGAWETRAGGGDVKGVEFTLTCPETPVKEIANLHRMWADLIAHGDSDTARRLRLDPAYRQDPRRLTVQMDREGTKGFTVTLDQLLKNGALWAPSLDVYVAAGKTPISFADHQKELEAWKDKRILDQVRRGPEATYEQYTALWEDMGSPRYAHPAQPAPGHVVCLSWDSTIHKFGVDRGAAVWSDLGNPDRFRFDFGLGDPSRGLAESWKGQKLTDGLPILTTVLEKDHVRHEVEQFAYPLNAPPSERRGDVPMVLLQKVKLTELAGETRPVSITMTHRRGLPASAEVLVAPQEQGKAFFLEDRASQAVLLCVEGEGIQVRAGDARVEKAEGGIAQRTTEVTVRLELPAKGSRELVVKLPSPAVPVRDREELAKLGYDHALEVTRKFWTDILARGAQFRVPEKVVNDLFRANLWHALRLPRRHGGQGADVKIDLPYSNFAYDQRGTPWPVNQAVYVDYMIYDLRGYHDLSAEELLTIYRNNQERNGHVGGVANWGVYTPAMMYAAAKNYRLSGRREALDRLLPPTLKALDWCLGEIKRGSERSGPSSGLVRAPLNDGTGEGVWAFNQAYVYAALDLLGQVLREIGHPRADECLTAARSFQQAVERGFGAAAMRSPLVQLRDHTWVPYVPSEVLTPGRLLQQWYPTDVDTGAMHLPRLKALPPDGALADSLIQDHEDNLYLKGWGMANEPVYNPQATVYLLRDNPKAAIRAFYSYMGCAFSHSALEPVEHRWTHGQYFGPPSTDGAWFELYRGMLIRELDDGALLLLQATPRKWLEDGKKIEVERAPTYYGTLSMTLESRAASGKLLAEIEMPGRSRPKVLLLRLRHPQERAIRSVTVNGRDWTDFDVRNEWIRIGNPDQRRYSVVASY